MPPRLRPSSPRPACLSLPIPAHGSPSCPCPSLPFSPSLPFPLSPPALLLLLGFSPSPPSLPLLPLPLSPPQPSPSPRLCSCSCGNTRGASSSGLGKVASAGSVWIVPVIPKSELSHGPSQTFVSSPHRQPCILLPAGAFVTLVATTAPALNAKGVPPASFWSKSPRTHRPTPSNGGPPTMQPQRWWPCHHPRGLP